jgi:GTPase Era involved in 16S rRNA processing
MSRWIAENIPAFAVVGRVNMGKSAVLSTLLEIDDDAQIRVSPTPGETTEVQVLPLILDGQERVRFLDTPGFSRAVDAMKRIQYIAGEKTPTLQDITKFSQECHAEFPDECRLLQPLIEGAGILYIVDPSKPLRDAFLAEMEILRWTGRPRLALLNQKEQDSPDQEEWRNRLGAAFNLVRTFNAHHARFDERLRLLKSLLEIEERHRAAIETTVDLIYREWENREEESAEIIVDFLESSLLLRSEKTIDAQDLEIPQRKEKHIAALSKEYYRKLAELEKTASEKLLKLYRHHLLKADLRENHHQGLDFESNETWKKWGLSRAQLTVAGAITGALAGVSIDIGTGGLTHGIPTAIAASTGAIAAFFKGGSLPNLVVSLDGMKLKKSEAKELSIGPPSNPNFPWILLDSILLIHQHILARAHGRRDREILKIDSVTHSFTSKFDRARRDTLQKWFSSCMKSSPDRGMEPQVYQEILNTLHEKADFTTP